MATKRYQPCILATCCIPWKEDGSFAEEIFRRRIRDLLANLTRHIYLFGTAGEGYAVTERQFDQIVRVFREETNQPDTHGTIGVISLSLPNIIERIERAREMGVRNFQISLPGWGALSDREVTRFFKEICGRFPDSEFMHYNLLRTRRLVTPDEYAVLAAEYPNLVAAKNSTDSMERIQALLTKAPQLQHFFTESGFAHGSLIGECGLLISIASIQYAEARRYFDAGQRRDSVTLFNTQRELATMLDDLVALGRNEAHMDGAYDKIFCKLRDTEFPLRLLPPYSGLSDETFQTVVTMIRNKYPRWANVRTN